MNNELPKTKIDEKTGIEYHQREIIIFPILQCQNKKR